MSTILNLTQIKANASGVTQGLQQLLSSTISMTSSALSAHWSITGPNFSELHELFGSQYGELFAAQDALAERIRMLRSFPQAECAGTPVLRAPFTPQEAISKLLKDREDAISAFYAVAKVARDSGDTVTENFLLGMIEQHEKAAWMLRSHLG